MPFNVPNLSFEDATVGQFVVDLRQMVGFGTLEITAKVETDLYQTSYIEATNVVTGAVHRIPEIDTWLRLVA